MVNLAKGLARRGVLELEPYTCARGLFKKAEVFLDANESPYGRAGLNRYPDSDQLELRRAIANYVGMGTSWRNVVAGNGSDELIDLAMRVFCERGDSIICVYPDYSMYRVTAEVNGLRVTVSQLGKDFRIDAESITSRADPRTKMVFFSSPNNPTGRLQPLEEIKKLAKGIKAMVFVDEAYAEFSGESAAGLVNKIPNLIVSRTFSKAWGLAGIRIGYVVASKEVIDLIMKIKPPYSVSVPSQRLALRALSAGRAKMAKDVRILSSDREAMAAGLSALWFEVFPSAANFLLCKCPRWADAANVQKKLAERSIIIRDFSGKRRLENSVRITIGRPKENRRLLLELRRVLAQSFDAVLFDIDGTLIDISQSYNTAIRLAAEELSGRRVSMREVQGVKAMEGMNNDWNATAELLRRIGSDATTGRVVPVFQRFYLGDGRRRGLISNEKALLDPGMLKAIGRRKVGIVTGRPRSEAMMAMEKLGLPRNTPLVSMDDCVEEKPAPEPLLLAKKLTGSVNPVYIGDSASDRAAAANAGMPFVAIMKGRMQKGEFARFGDVNAALRGLFE